MQVPQKLERQGGLHRAAFAPPRLRHWRHSSSGWLLTAEVLVAPVAIFESAR